MVITELLTGLLTETPENRNSPVYLVLLTKGERTADMLMQKHSIRHYILSVFSECLGCDKSEHMLSDIFLLFCHSVEFPSVETRVTEKDVEKAKCDIISQLVAVTEQ